MSEITPASREQVEQLKIRASARPSYEGMHMSRANILSLIAWGEAAERRAARSHDALLDHCICLFSESGDKTTRRCDYHAEIERRAEAAESRAAQAEAALRECVGALKPFAEAADDLDEGARDKDDCWESSAAMAVTAGDFRRAQAALSTPPAAVALAERKVIEAAIVYMTKHNAGALYGQLRTAVTSLLAARAAKDEGPGFGCKEYSPNYAAMGDCQNCGHAQSEHPTPAPASEGERHEFVPTVALGDDAMAEFLTEHGPCNLCGKARNHPIHGGE